MKSLSEETYRLFEEAYDHFNRSLFAGELPVCLITFQRQTRLMGYASFRRWVNDEEEFVDELAINPEYFANFPLTEIFQTLCHEMVHIWQHHFGSPSRRGYHNAEWAQKMKSIGLIPSSTGKPGGNIVGEHMLDYVHEGGDFATACQALIDSGFELKWIDTYPIPNKNIPTAQYTKHLALLKTASAPETSLAVLTERLPDSDNTPSDLPYSMEDLDTALEASMSDDQMPASTRLTTTRPRNRSNRNKYYCSRCFIQAWGKPGLHLLCGDCNQRLIESD